MSVSIWVKEDEIDEAVEKIKQNKKDEPNFEGQEIDELYIDGRTGKLEGYIEVEEIGVGLFISFEDWFSQFLKFNSFEKLTKFMSEHEEKVKKAQKKMEEIKEQIKKARQED